MAAGGVAENGALCRRLKCGENGLNAGWLAYRRKIIGGESASNQWLAAAGKAGILAAGENIKSASSNGWPRAISVAGSVINSCNGMALASAQPGSGESSAKII